MKKVLIIITTGFSQYGGLSSVIMNYLRNINYDGIKIDILSGNNPEPDLIEECCIRGIDYIQCTGRKKNPLAYIFKLKKILKEYDVVHINANSATAAFELIAATSAGVKNRIVHNHTARCDYAILHKILYPIYTLLYTQAIACSEKAGNWIYGNNNFLILNNSIDTKKYEFSCEDRMDIRNHYNIDNEIFVVGHVGKIYKPKNHRKVISIFNILLSEIPSAKLLLVGDGEMRNEIEEYVTELGINSSVIFTGLRKDTNRYMSAMDCFLFPSIWEGMPLALLEAQASGLHCVISNTIDCNVSVSDNVIVRDLEEPDEKWVESIREAINYDRNKSCESNIKKLKHNGYDVKLNANKLKELYEGNNI